jgi:hypothetical protein
MAARRSSPHATRRNFGGEVWSVLVIGVASGLLYVVVVATERRIQGSSSSGETSASQLDGVFVIATLAMFALFGALLLICSRGGLVTRKARVIAIAFPVLFNVVLVFVPPRLSIDLLSYVSHGYINTVLHGNSLAEPSSIVADTPLGPDLARLGWRPVHPASPYGPLWTRIESAADGDFRDVQPAMTVLKIVVTIASLASSLLIWHVLGLVRPDRRLFGTLAYLWNPLIVMEIAGEGHNDSVMVFFVLLALLLAIRGRGSGSLVAMSLGVLTKYLPLFLMPPQIAFLWRTRRSTGRFAREVIVGSAVSATLTVILFAGIWVGRDTWTGVRASARIGSTGSTPTMITETLSRLWSSAVLESITAALVIALFVIYVGKVTGSVVNKENLIGACAAVGVTYVLVASPAYWPWYVVLPAALLALVTNASAAVLLFVVSLGARVVAPLDLLYVQEVIDRGTYFTLTWVLGLGFPAATAILLHLKGGWSPLAPARGPSNRHRDGASPPGVAGSLG